MTDINHVVLVGRITRDCGADQNSFGYMQNGTCYARISIAVNKSRKDGSGNRIDDASFFNISIFGKLAETLKPYLTKGKQIAVEGCLKQDRWQKNGQNFSSISVIANQIQILTPKNESDGGCQQQNSQAVADVHQQPDMEFSEDIPF